MLLLNAIYHIASASTSPTPFSAVLATSCTCDTSKGEKCWSYVDLGYVAPSTDGTGFCATPAASGEACNHLGGAQGSARGPVCTSPTVQTSDVYLCATDGVVTDTGTCTRFGEAKDPCLPPAHAATGDTIWKCGAGDRFLSCYGETEFGVHYSLASIAILPDYIVQPPTCGYRSSDSTCGDDLGYYCDDGQSCTRAENDSEGICETPLTINGHCLINRSCITGDKSSGLIGCGTDGGKCHKTASIGSSCNDLVLCQDPGSSCIDGTCQWTPGDLGDMCQTAPGADPCVAGLNCITYNTQTGTGTISNNGGICSKPTANEAPCDISYSTSYCTSPEVCATVDGFMKPVCYEFGIEGNECRPPQYLCGSSLLCLDVDTSGRFTAIPDNNKGYCWQHSVEVGQLCHLTPGVDQVACVPCDALNQSGCFEDMRCDVNFATTCQGYGSQGAVCRDNSVNISAPECDVGLDCVLWNETIALESEYQYGGRCHLGVSEGDQCSEADSIYCLAELQCIMGLCSPKKGSAKLGETCLEADIADFLGIPQCGIGLDCVDYDSTTAIGSLSSVGICLIYAPFEADCNLDDPISYCSMPNTCQTVHGHSSDVCYEFGVEGHHCFPNDSHCETDLDCAFVDDGAFGERSFYPYGLCRHAADTATDCSGWSYCSYPYDHCVEDICEDYRGSSSIVTIIAAPAIAGGFVGCIACLFHFFQMNGSTMMRWISVKFITSSAREANEQANAEFQFVELSELEDDQLSLDIDIGDDPSNRFNTTLT